VRECKCWKCCSEVVSLILMSFDGSGAAWRVPYDSKHAPAFSLVHKGNREIDLYFIRDFF
jgi:hypothetical protein